MSTKVQYQESSTFTSLADNAPTLRSAFRANAVLSLIFGLSLLLASEQVASFLGIQHMQFFGRFTGASLVMDVGIVAVAFAAWVGYTITRSTISRPNAIAILVGDVVWVVDSVLLVVTNALPLTTPGIWAVLITADLVLALAIWEYIGIRRMV